MMENPKINVRSTDERHIPLLRRIVLETLDIKATDIQGYYLDEKRGVLFFTEPPTAPRDGFTDLCPRLDDEGLDRFIGRYLKLQENKATSNRSTFLEKDRYDPDNDGLEIYGYRFYTKSFDHPSRTGAIFAVIPSFGHVGK